MTRLDAVHPGEVLKQISWCRLVFRMLDSLGQSASPRRE